MSTTRTFTSKAANQMTSNNLVQLELNWADSHGRFSSKRNLGGKGGSWIHSWDQTRFSGGGHPDLHLKTNSDFLQFLGKYDQRFFQKLDKTIHAQSNTIYAYQACVTSKNVDTKLWRQRQKLIFKMTASFWYLKYTTRDHLKGTLEEPKQRQV